MKVAMLFACLYFTNLQAQVVFKPYFPAKAGMVQRYNVTMNDGYNTPGESLEK
jgi:hypothetical protein